MKRKRTRKDRHRFATPGMHRPTKHVQERIDSQLTKDPVEGTRTEIKTLTMAASASPGESPEDYRARLRKHFTPEMFADAAKKIMKSGSDRDKTRILSSVGKYLGLEAPATINHVVSLGANFASTTGARVSHDEAPLPTHAYSGVLPEGESTPELPAAEGDEQGDGDDA